MGFARNIIRCVPMKRWRCARQLQSMNRRRGSIQRACANRSIRGTCWCAAYGDEVFLSEVLWGERVGLLPEDERWYTMYFAQFPIARFDSQELRVTPLPKTQGWYKGGEAGDMSPASPPARVERDQKVSGMCPV